MTTPGPDILVACPRCGRRAFIPTRASGNTAGARLWTDGAMRARHWSEQPAFTRCRRCGGFYWLEEQQVGTSNASTRGFSLGCLTSTVLSAVLVFLVFPRAGLCELFLLVNLVLAALLVPWLAWRERFRVPERLPEADLLAALDAGLGDTPARELRLRRDAWWAANDAARVRPGATPPARSARSAEATANLVRLRELLDASTPEGRLMKAEASRQLGDFEAALAWLDAPFEEFQAMVAQTIRALARRQETTVAEVPFPD
jgi:hypothetical protein